MAEWFDTLSDAKEQTGLVLLARHSLDSERSARQYAWFESLEGLWQHVSENRNKYSYHEVILPGRRFRMYFDLEMITEGAPDGKRVDRLNAIRDATKRALVRAQIIEEDCDPKIAVINGTRRVSTNPVRIKNSDHIVFQTVCVDSPRTASLLCALVADVMTDAESHLVRDVDGYWDIGVYRENGTFRIATSMKSHADRKPLLVVEPEPPYRKPAGLFSVISQDTLITASASPAEHVVTLDALTKVISGTSSLLTNAIESVQVYREIKPLSHESAQIESQVRAALQEWLSSSEEAQSLAWENAKIDPKVFGTVSGRTDHFMFSISNPRRNMVRWCPGGTQHKGGCGKQWRIKTVVVGGGRFKLYSACWGQKESRACSMRGRKLRWLPIMSSKGGAIASIRLRID